MAPPRWAHHLDYFEPQPDEELICSICKNVFYQPVKCPCKHVFCEPCIHAWLGTNTSCPICRNTATLHSLEKVVPILTNIIMKLTLRCHNDKNGCMEKIKLENYEDHLKECEFNMIHCKNKHCKVYLVQKDIKKHELHDCAYRSLKCKTCALRILAASFDKHNCIAKLQQVLKKKQRIIKKNQNQIQDLKKELQKAKERVCAFCSPAPSRIQRFQPFSSDFTNGNLNHDNSLGYPFPRTTFPGEPSVLSNDTAYTPHARSGNPYFSSPYFNRQFSAHNSSPRELYVPNEEVYNGAGPSSSGRDPFGSLLSHSSPETINIPSDDSTDDVYNLSSPSNSSSEFSLRNFHIYFGNRVSDNEAASQTPFNDVSSSSISD